MMLATDLVVLDHYDGSAILVANAILPPDADDGRSAGRLPPGGRPAGRDDHRAVPADPADDLHRRAAAGRATAQPYAGGRLPEGGRGGQGGDPGRRVLPDRGRPALRAADHADPLDVYRVLRTTNPSPYMYLLRFDGFDIVGSSPEAHLKVHRRPPGAAAPDRRHPAARRDPRAGRRRLAAELLADPKERAEHVMLVDLGRNDLGRVCGRARSRCRSSPRIERYSHVMHIVSTVVGRAAATTRRAFDALAATFPAGTLSRRAQGAGDGDHRGAGADPARRLRRHGRLLRLRRRPGHGDRDPHRADPRRRGLRAGRRRHRRRLRPGGRGAGDPQQGRRRARRDRRRRDAAGRPDDEPGRRRSPYRAGACVGSARGWRSTRPTRTWESEHAPTRVAPCRRTRHRPDRAATWCPGLAALALVGLAGAGALLATRGVGRRLVGVLRAARRSGPGGLRASVGRSTRRAPAWPVARRCSAACWSSLGGLCRGAGAATAGRRMGARYERSPKSRGRHRLRRRVGRAGPRRGPDGQVRARLTLGAAAS